MAKPGWVDEVLKFWFEELKPEHWYAGGAEVDAKIRDRFGDLHRELMAELPPEVMTDPRAALAAVVAFDQFPRNIHRGRADAFSSDDLALRIARNALDKGFEAGFSNAERQFLYMPFMHSEVLADQERCVSLVKSLGNEEGEKYAIEHRDIVARFGRFPHRNRALGRTSTPDEVEFLKTHDGYGQKTDEPDQA
jgi:uncharacterized protein (DUF924 family)